MVICLEKYPHIGVDLALFTKPVGWHNLYAMKMFLIVEQLKYSDITNMKQQRIATFLSLFLNGHSALDALVNVLTMLKDMIKFREIDLQMFFF